MLRCLRSLTNGKTQLLVIAGCNGAGKSSYSRILSPEGIAVFGYDKHFLEIYSSIIPTDFQDQMAHNMTFQKLETQIDQAIDAGKSFAYETNFNSDPLHWPLIFKAKGYAVNMIYFCLNSVEEAQKRVAIRVENGGHFVPDSEIISFWSRLLMPGIFSFFGQNTSTIEGSIASFLVIVFTASILSWAISINFAKSLSLIASSFFFINRI
ncbi:zeta toxin family protein [Algoriphagus sp. Y33]|uniref:zeta toxin family protein n=1 Tax=Algoriphagus sp. Y33 TaxID=2772483 RepID=UPI001CE0D48D|nr:zeta toxin family protein [Algoriphagus sp. Y33]